MKGFDSRYQFGLSVALAIHIAVLGLLILDKSAPRQGGDAQKPQIIEAVSIDEKAVDAAIANIQHKKNVTQQRADNEIRQAHLQKQREIENLQQIREQLAAEKQKQQAITDANKLAANKLKELKAQQAEMAEKQLQAKQKLEAVKKASEVAALTAKRNAAIAKAKAEAARLAEEEQARESAELEKSRAQRETQVAGVLNKYAVLIVKAIGKQWILPPDADRKVSCRVQVRIAATGQVLAVSVVKSSGNAIIDRAATAAVYKASPLPVPNDSDIYAKMRVINLTLRPEQVISG